jgi:hypothetical protein
MVFIFDFNIHAFFVSFLYFCSWVLLEGPKFIGSYCVFQMFEFLQVTCCRVTSYFVVNRFLD